VKGGTALAGLLATLALALAGMAALGASSAGHDAEEEASSGRLCAGCHTTAHASGEHAGLACGGCHAVDRELADRLAWSTTGVASLPDHAEITACGQCHEERPGAAVTSEGHRAHAHVEGSCAGCHEALHTGDAPAACERCHADVARHGPTADVACTSCHLFGAERALVTPDGAATDDGGITGALEAFAGLGAGLGAGTHGRAPPIGHRVHGAMDCRQCHDPHQAEQAQITCENCHRGYLAEQVRTSAHDGCTDCHEAHGDRERSGVDCLQCHTYPERGRGWIVDPAGVPEAVRAATRARLTHDGDCASCHDPHTSEASFVRCAGCHGEETAAVDTLPDGAHDGCPTCHQPHEPAPTSTVCTSCHADVHAPSSNVAQHRDCLSCHDPHYGRAMAQRSCSSCHADAHRQTQASASAHRDCLSCHEEHGAPLGPTASSCAGCHADQGRTMTASGVPDAHRCGSCHEPHRFAAGNGATTRCASCHTQTVSAHASHRGTCTGCHEEHGAPLGDAASCAASSCHQAVHPSIAGHLACGSCHTPHQPAVRALDTCGTCHGREVANAARWPRQSPHRGECTACHVPHDERRAPDDRGGDRTTLCGSCHAPQTARAHTGGHDGCTGCHDPHDAPASASGLGGAWWASCASCHATQARAVAASTGTHGQCAACHQSPGPPLPTCASCHTGTRTPRLGHTQHAEASCASCHADHGTPPPSPDTCRSCHTDRRDHFADAPSCQSCHPFR
jgi:hypothetical protein